MDDKTLKAISKLLGEKDYTATLSIRRANHGEDKEKHITVQAKNFSEAKQKANKELEKLRRQNPGFLCDGMMDKFPVGGDS